ncbi:hypothetical protein M409DRAFT_55505 [Zasmidium cellare ATCC 36951]|uniref:Zn(2)-C6 fungal-type domain-containing protein n=1 Tax=Zasmidium cellare ATCC 36951 TaxID=1080233 RepID=A0A6A6CHD3_ZASCE|nr:uncharacterized protein M409DRAFT_55505 [Zasmidium cellare ATCC 36951]KAF2165608.1 hypothetical protein M409DRAFT_55505 [Zasmidium cellare ATCC 36951]
MPDTPEKENADLLPRSGPSNSRQCPFCASTFSRVDATRRHALRCPKRQGRALQLKTRGRRAQACDECSRLKVHCDRLLDKACQRCASRKLKCTFDQARASTTRSQPLQEETYRPRNLESRRVSLSFLLSSTDDKQDFVIEKAIAEEPDRTLLGPTCLSTQDQSPSDSLWDLDLSQTSPFDLDILLMPPELDGLYSTEDQCLVDVMAFPKPWDALLSNRIDMLRSELSQYSKSRIFGTGPDRDDFSAFFNTTNVQFFAMTFCRKRHYQYPIIHWPTLMLEEVPLPLLLAVSLTGAAYSLSKEHGTKHAAGARKFYAIADVYIFDQLDAALAREHDGKYRLQLCQAALLMYGLGVLLSSDSSMQQTAITKRLPTLIPTLRKLDLIGCRHDASEDWGQFLHREQIIRLVAWTYCADCLATLVSNKPPGFSLLEMSGDLPCDPATWEIDTALRFESLECQRKPPRPTLVELMTGFLNDDPIGDFKNVPTFHLHVVLCAFQHHVYNLHVTMALIDQSLKVLKALSTWRRLWANAISSLSDGDRQWLGVAKHVSDLEYLTQRIVEVAVSPQAASSPYLRRIPSSGARIVHEFIRDYVSVEE